MKVKFWGVRGSIPTPGPNTIRYGGNTPCIELRSDDGRLFILEAGSGIRELGNALMGEYRGRRIEAAIMISHTHWDHIQGFPFFVPIYVPNNSFSFYGPYSIDSDLEQIVSGQMTFQYFPVKLEHVTAKIDFHELKAGEYEINGSRVIVKYMNHPVPTIGYRIYIDDKIFVYTGDNEPFQNIFAGSDSDSEDSETKLMLEEAEEAVQAAHQGMIEFASDADIFIMDAQYTKEEYESKRGWGHSTYEDAIEIGRTAGAKRVVVFHHDPARTDEELERIILKHRRDLSREGTPFHFIAAQEGLEIEI